MSTEKETLTQKFVKWCDDPSPEARLQRTAVQGVIGVVVAYSTLAVNAPEIVTLLVIPIVMAVLAPIQAMIGGDKQ